MSNKERVTLLWAKYKDFKHPLHHSYEAGVDLERLALDIGLTKRSLALNLLMYKRSCNLSASTCLKLATYFNQDPQVWLDKKINYELKMWFQTYRKLYAKVPECIYESPIWEAKTSNEIEDQIKQDGAFATLCQFQKDEGFSTHDIESGIHPLGLSWTRILYTRSGYYSADESIRLGLYLGIDVELLFRENINAQIKVIQKGESNEENSSL